MAALQSFQLPCLPTRLKNATQDGVLHHRMNPAPSSSRRHFLKTTAAAVTAFNIVPRHVLGGPRFVPPSEKVNVANDSGVAQERQEFQNLAFPEPSLHSRA